MANTIRSGHSTAKAEPASRTLRAPSVQHRGQAGDKRQGDQPTHNYHDGQRDGGHIESDVPSSLRLIVGDVKRRHHAGHPVHAAPERDRDADDCAEAEALARRGDELGKFVAD